MIYSFNSFGVHHAAFRLSKQKYTAAMSCKGRQWIQNVSAASNFDQRAVYFWKFKYSKGCRRAWRPVLTSFLRCKKLEKHSHSTLITKRIHAYFSNCLDQPYSSTKLDSKRHGSFLFGIQSRKVSIMKVDMSTSKMHMFSKFQKWRAEKVVINALSLLTVTFISILRRYSALAENRK